MVFKAKVRNLLTLFDTGGLKQPPLIGFLLVPEKNKWEVFSILLLSWIWIWRCLNHFFRPHFTFGGQETNKNRHFPLFIRWNSVQGSKSTKKATKIGTPFMVITSITPISNVTSLKKNWICERELMNISIRYKGKHLLGCQMGTTLLSYWRWNSWE